MKKLNKTMTALLIATTSVMMASTSSTAAWYDIGSDNKDFNSYMADYQKEQVYQQNLRTNNENNNLLKKMIARDQAAQDLVAQTAMINRLMDERDAKQAANAMITLRNSQADEMYKSFKANQAVDTAAKQANVLEALVRKVVSKERLYTE